LIAVLGGAVAAWPFAARAQQAALPVIGFLNVASPDGYRPMTDAFRQGLQESGYVDGQNVAIEYRWAENRIDRLPAMAADLVRRQVTVIAATGTAAALAAKAATTTIPIVFEMGGDPVQLGLVASLNRPGGNVTGVTQLVQELTPKLLELLHELLPTTRVVGLLINPTDSAVAEFTARHVLAAAHTLGLELHVLNASSERDFDGVFAKLIELPAGGLVIGGEALFTSHSEQLAALAARHGVPTVYKGREFAAAGGLLSYGYRTLPSPTAWPASMLVGFSRVRSLPSFRSSRQPKSSSSSTSRPPRRSASRFRCPCRGAPMRCLNNGFAALHESGNGTKCECRFVPLTSALE
jgi:putative tryptophan/tyrosine transport system substrate-binding protein